MTRSTRPVRSLLWLIALLLPLLQGVSYAHALSHATTASQASVGKALVLEEASCELCVGLATLGAAAAAGHCGIPAPAPESGPIAAPPLVRHHQPVLSRHARGPPAFLV